VHVTTGGNEPLYGFNRAQLLHLQTLTNETIIHLCLDVFASVRQLDRCRHALAASRFTAAAWGANDAPTLDNLVDCMVLATMLTLYGQMIIEGKPLPSIDAPHARGCRPCELYAILHAEFGVPETSPAPPSLRVVQAS
jgi:hypothetical protein